MRFLAGIIFCALATASSPVYSADPNQIFSTILGEIGRQIEREQQKKQLRQLRPYWDACARGDVAACDDAARFPNLTAQARADIARMRHNAQIRPAYVRNFYACQKMDRAACQAALAYPYLNETDRRNLQSWKRLADERHKALAAFQLHQRDCFRGSIPDCDAAIKNGHLDQGAVPELERWRAQLQAKKDQRERRARDQQRQDEERLRQAALTAFRQNQRSCYGGWISACDAAISNRHLDESAIPGLKRQRAKLQQEERERHARDQRQQAALAAFRHNQRKCHAGSIAACDAAISNRHLDQSAIPDLERRRAQLRLAERQRRAKERQRQAAIHEYARLRKNCAAGERPACKLAIAHAQVRSSDIAFLEKQHRALAPLGERVANFFTEVNLGSPNDAGSNGHMGFAVLGVIALFGVGAGTLFVMRKRGVATPARPEPLNHQPETPSPTAEPETAQTFTLTGHMPTDVRRAILEATQ
jgi:hypothetical protein